jgi:hypothetical protein
MTARNVLRGSGGKVFYTKAHERMALEKYYTPRWATEALLRHLSLNPVAAIYEPAAGDGGVATPLKDAGYQVFASDIAPDASWIWQQNFFTVARTPVRGIITNPPYGTGGGLAVRFCWHALRLMEPGKGIVAMLLRDDFDSAGGRQQLFKYNPAWHKKIVLTERLRWTNLEQKKAGPSNNHAWYIWDWARDPSALPVIVYEGRE